MMLEFIFSSTLEVSLAVSIFLAVLLSVPQKYLDRYLPRSRNLLWMILAIRLLFPLQPDFRPVTVRFVAPYRLTGLPPETRMPNLSLIQILTMVWAFGVFLYLLVHLIWYKRFERRMERGRAFSSLSPAQSRLAKETFYEVKYALGIYDPISLWISSEASGPMLLGFCHPKVVIPDCPMDQKNLEMIFRHELMHHRRHDSWYRLMLLGAFALHWFNPLVYWMARRAAQDLESSCDRSVVSGQPQEFVCEYAQALLNTAKCLMKRQNVHQTVLVSYFSSGAQRLKKRFAELFSPARKAGVCLIVLSALFVVFSSSLVFVQGNDQNLEWAEKLKVGDISSINIAQEQDLQMGTEYYSAQVKDDFVDWLGNINFKPALYQARNRTEKERMYVTQKDGSLKRVSVFSDGSIQVDGKEYWTYHS